MSHLRSSANVVSSVDKGFLKLQRSLSSTGAVQLYQNTRFLLLAREKDVFISECSVYMSHNQVLDSNSNLRE